MARSRRRFAAHGVCGGDNSRWKVDERRRFRRVNAVRVLTGAEPLIKHESGIHNWWQSPSDGRYVYFVSPDPDTTGADRLRWWRRCLRK
jgi:hypothetical protein